MIDFEIQLDEQGLEQMAQELDTALQSAMQQTMESALSRARTNLEGGSGLHSRTGFLAASLGYDLAPDGDGWLGTLYSDADYAAVHEFGAYIQARQAAYLKFQVGGQWVQVQAVTIPARPFLNPATEDSLGDLEAYLTQALT